MHACYLPFQVLIRSLVCCSLRYCSAVIADLFEMSHISCYEVSHLVQPDHIRCDVVVLLLQVVIIMPGIQGPLSLCCLGIADTML